PGFDPVVQLLTTRGFAVAAVDYAGSTGYGRDYRRALGGRWGEADVDDCVDAARSLAAEGRVDGRRMAIRGSSAGGLTALGALVRSDAFAGAVAWYGVTDLLALAAATHDFEAHYTEWLVGPLPAAADEYRRRSPSHRTADVRGAVLLLQGLDDPVVPPAQATAMAEALQAQGLPCELVTFPGESHGFRRAETVERSLRAELDFYVDRLCGP
ncbi:MAG: S9 family peptidase, partial [Acidimicrobiales bacterium]